VLISYVDYKTVNYLDRLLLKPVKPNRLKLGIIKITSILYLIILFSCNNLNPLRKTVTIQVGSVDYVTEISRTEEEMGLGLMYRTKLLDTEAMIFIYERDDNLSFWMKNTKIDLSIAFIDSRGIIREIHDMKAGSLTPVRSIIAARYALEVAKGSFERRGVRVGDYVDLSSLH
jgi:uncharacterized membrane protein (UPF0127 family)